MDLSIGTSEVNGDRHIYIPSTSEVVNKTWLFYELNSLQAKLPGWLTEVIFQFENLIGCLQKLVNCNYCRPINWVCSIRNEISDLNPNFPVSISVA